VQIKSMMETVNDVGKWRGEDTKRPCLARRLHGAGSRSLTSDAKGSENTHTKRVKSMRIRGIHTRQSQNGFQIQ
jgi:hypothetical protein